MKTLKYIIVVLVLTAVGLTIVYQRRDSIARDLANSLLGGSELRIIDVELDTLLASRVAFGRLEIELPGGSRLVITDLDAPLSFPSLEPEYVAIRELRYTPSAAIGRSALTPGVRTLLDLPRRFPRAALTIGRASVGDYPAATDIVWNSADDLQRLYLNFAGLALRAETATVDSGSYRMNLAIDAPDRGEVLALDGSAVDENGELQLSVYGSAQIEPFLQALDDAGLIPDAILSMSGKLYGMTNVRLDDGAPGSAGFLIQVASDGDVTVRTDAGVPQEILAGVSPGSPAEIRLSYPDLAWSLRVPRSTWATDIDGLQLMQFRLTNLECTDEMRCDFDLGAGPAPLKLPGVDIERALFDLSVEASIDEAVQLGLTGEPSMFLSGISAGAVAIGSMTTTTFEAGRLRIADGKVSGGVGNLSLSLSNLAAGGATMDALALRLSDIALTAGGGQSLSASLRVPENSGTLTWRDYSLRNPEISGEVQWRGPVATGELALADRRGGVSASASFRHDTGLRSGDMRVRDGLLDFAARHAGEWIRGLPANFDLIGGKLDFGGQLAWQPADDGYAVTASASLAPIDLLARYRDVGAAGIGGNIAVSRDDAGVTISRSELSASLVDVGFPLEDLKLRFRSAPQGGIAVDDMEARLLGGRIHAEPFVYEPGEKTNRLVLRPQSIQLPFIAELAGFDSIDVEGSVSGEIPVNVSGKIVAIASGKLESEPPGGVLRLDAGTAAEATGGSNLAIASRALRNFQFDSLTSTVEYSGDGDLSLRMRLSGVNPDMDPDQPIIVNLSVEDNIPQLLRSLQAVRSIEEILERRAGRQ